MNASTISKILQGEQITENELSEFVIAYVKKFKDKDLDSRELSEILHLVRSGIFNLGYAAQMASKYADSTIYFLHDREGQLLKILPEV